MKRIIFPRAALSYALGQGAPPAVNRLLAAMFVLFIAGLACLVASKS